MVPGEQTAVEVTERHIVFFTRFIAHFGTTTATPNLFLTERIAIGLGGGGDGIDDKGNYAFNILRMKSVLSQRLFDWSQKAMKQV